jgi:uncharacterized protein YhbP (UPF0306 family)
MSIKPSTCEYKEMGYQEKGHQEPGYQELIETSNVMNIAICDCNGPWSAPVYYVLLGQNFYFFSNPDARHIKMAENQLSSAAIYKDDPCINNLQGVQMSGKTQKASLGAKSISVAKKYCNRFKIKIKVKDLDILDFFSLKVHASLYRFEPDLIYYMDNKQGFGHRERIKL